MSDTEPFAPPTSRKLVRQTAGPVDKRRRKRGLTVAVRTAIDAWVYDRCTRAQACERAGFTERALYLALEKPEVAAYYNKQLDVLRTGERPQNIRRLAEIRDAGNNMPAVNAIKTLEMLGDEPTNKSNAPSPGIVLRLVTINQSTVDTKVIEHEHEHEPEPEPVQRSEPIFKLD